MGPANLSTAAPQGELASRQAAVELLRALFDRRTGLDQALEASPAIRALSHADRAFALRLVRLVSARHGELDALLAAFIETPLPENAKDIVHILRLGLAQLLLSEIPPHAAVHSSVELAKRSRFKGFAGLVNAVLKRAARDGEALLKRQDGFALNTPDWLRKRLADAYGDTQARAIYAAQLQEVPVDITPRPGSDVAAMAANLQGTKLPTGTIRLHQVSGLENLPGYREGSWWVQDAAAALPARLLGNVAGRDVLDLCAAPGGKTMQLAASGARVTAVDRSAPRMVRLKENLQRMKLDAECITADATQWQPDRQWGHILLDAPCSATGTLRRHPDVALTRGDADIRKLAALQDSLLDKAFEWLEPGGTLVYAVCSLLPEEGEKQTQRLLARQSNARLLPADAAEIPAELLTPRGELRTLPSAWADQGGMDGFYAARLTKVNP